jgi:hypothetical protein
MYYIKIVVQYFECEREIFQQEYKPPSLRREAMQTDRNLQPPCAGGGGLLLH